MLVFPGSCIIIELYAGKEDLLINLVGKWFIFWSVGIRLFTAGLKQSLNPSFTAKDIFHLKEKESFVVVKELGFANICFGIMGIISLFISHWRVVAAFTGGLYFLLAGMIHIFKKPAGTNEWIALISDIFIAVVMLAYITCYIIQPGVI